MCLLEVCGRCRGKEVSFGYTVGCHNDRGLCCVGRGVGRGGGARPEKDDRRELRGVDGDMKGWADRRRFVA